jgi:hypothetical protein
MTMNMSGPFTTESTSRPPSFRGTQYLWDIAMRLLGDSRLMTVFRALAAAAQVVLVVLIACLFLMVVVPSAFILLALLVSETTMVAMMSIFILTFLVLVSLLVVVAKGLWRSVMAREDRT